MNLNENLCELFGIFLGDGCLSETARYSEIVIAGDITEEREFYNKHIIPLFNKELAIPLINKEIKGRAYPKVGVYGIYSFNKKLVQEFKKTFNLTSGPKTNIVIPQNILSNKKFLIKVLKGLFETDGSIYFEKNYSCKDNSHKHAKIKLCMTSRNLIDQIYNSLIHLDFKPIRVKPYKGKKDKNYLYGIKLYRKKDILRWIEEIGFDNPKHKTKIIKRKHLRLVIRQFKSLLEIKK